MTTTYTLHSLSGLGGMFSLGDDRDSGPMRNLHVNFPNGVTLSLAWGRGAYAGPDTVEVAVIGPNDGEDWLTESIAKAAFGEDIDDIVDGYCDADRVHAYFLAAQGYRDVAA